MMNDKELDKELIALKSKIETLKSLDTLPTTYEDAVLNYDEYHLKDEIYCIDDRCDVDNHKKNYVCSEKVARELNALTQLLLLRDIYRRGETDEDDRRYAVINTRSGFIIDESISTKRTFSFQYLEVAQRFRDSFIDLMTQAGDLI